MCLRLYLPNTIKIIQLCDEEFAKFFQSLNYAHKKKHFSFCLSFSICMFVSPLRESKSTYLKKKIKTFHDLDIQTENQIKKIKKNHKN